MKTPEVRGSVVDHQTRCVHYFSDRDIIAIKFACCGAYYPCYKCHQDNAGHPVRLWERHQFNKKAILCGCCQKELSISSYLNTDNCPNCHAAFNPGCRNHHHLYFNI
ncbi:CHY zinc finger protein [Sediminibacillus massiliensis]|uniref:CHY zinc finger protein n=1 Tax=Sediminibacillus massiliensis TaxID=1926277 RepID=UPI0009887380|nr:CHY zinc finger protein [Sediminibacillus massiliensis]